MKLVTAVRHAKSDWGAGLPDFDRPLNHRGLRNAPQMGQRLLKRSVRPDIWITSPANRAETTAHLIANQMGYAVEDIIVRDELYGAGTTQILEVLSEVPNHCEHAMFFCHNPGITDFVNRIANARIANIPTCGVVELEFQIDEWSDITRTRGVKKNFDYPKK